MKNYELLCLVSSQYTEDEVKKIKEKTDAILKKAEAVIGWQDFLGRKKLAYPVNRLAHGYYFLTEFELESGEKIKELDQILKLDKEILRHQIVAKPKITPQEIARQERQKQREQEGEETKPTPRIRQKDQREEKPREAEEEKIERVSDKKKVSIENLDEKLDELLKDENINI